MMGKSQNSIGNRRMAMFGGSKLRSEKKNSVERFTVLFAGGKAYVGDQAYPLGELTTELLNYPDEQLFELRHLAERMLAFRSDSFYDPETKKRPCACPCNAGQDQQGLRNYLRHAAI
jgi:hypothetical protein